MIVPDGVEAPNAPTTTFPKPMELVLLPEMTFRAAAVVPPIKLLSPDAIMTPLNGLPRGADPAALVPIKLPATVLLLEAIKIPESVPDGPLARLITRPRTVEPPTPPKTIPLRPALLPLIS